MTAKNRLILSIIAIVTTLVVAGSMIFIIFAATRGQVNGSFTINYGTNMQIYATMTTRYTTTPLTTGFGNGEGDKIVKTVDGKDSLEFKGWETVDTNFALEPLDDGDIQLSIDNPWVIFEVELADTGMQLSATISLMSGTTYDNVDILVGAPTNRMTDISPEMFDSFYHKSSITTNNDTYNAYYIDVLYYMIRIQDTTQDAFFSGGLNIDWSILL